MSQLRNPLLTHSTHTLHTAGALRWAFPTPGGVTSTPSVSTATGLVYVGSDNGLVYAVNGSSGAQVWAFATGYRVYSAPAVDPVGNVYVHTEWELCVAGAGGRGKGLTTQ